MTKKIDYTVQRSGSLFLFAPKNAEAQKHLEDRVSDEAIWMGGALVVEHGYARDLATRLQEAGFIVN